MSDAFIVKFMVHDISKKLYVILHEKQIKLQIFLIDFYYLAQKQIPEDEKMH